MVFVVCAVYAQFIIYFAMTRIDRHTFDAMEKSNEFCLKFDLNLVATIQEEYQKWINERMMILLEALLQDKLNVG